MVRIRSEHTIGFLKGQSHSLKGVRINIVDEQTHKLATYWIVSCIAVHSFAMQCEEEERAEDGSDYDPTCDLFVAEGMDGGESDWSDVNVDRGEGRGRRGPRFLEEAKQRQEKLKEALFHSR